MLFNLITVEEFGFMLCGVALTLLVNELVVIAKLITNYIKESIELKKEA